MGVSGGADSICLLHVLALLAPSFQWKLAVVHVNHLIRREAGEDAAYVEETCRQLGVSFYLTEVDVEALGNPGGCPWRRPAVRCATVLFMKRRKALGRMVLRWRITGMTGRRRCFSTCSAGQAWAAWHPSGRGADNIIRPLLCVGREEIEQWLRGKKYPLVRRQ